MGRKPLRATKSYWVLDNFDVHLASKLQRFWHHGSAATKIGPSPGIDTAPYPNQSITRKILIQPSSIPITSSSVDWSVATSMSNSHATATYSSGIIPSGSCLRLDESRRDLENWLCFRTEPKYSHDPHSRSNIWCHHGTNIFSPCAHMGAWK